MRGTETCISIVECAGRCRIHIRTAFLLLLDRPNQLSRGKSRDVKLAKPQHMVTEN